jgi:hypothetical protein
MVEKGLFSSPVGADPSRLMALHSLVRASVFFKRGPLAAPPILKNEMPRMG